MVESILSTLFGMGRTRAGDAVVHKESCCCGTAPALLVDDDANTEVLSIAATFQFSEKKVQ